MDVDMDNDMNKPSRRPNVPRLNHKKSRTGCLSCKRRRVKCDEKRPSCTSCSRHMVECAYPNPPSTSARRAGASSSAASSQTGTARLSSPASELGSHPHQAHQAHAQQTAAVSPLSNTASSTHESHTPESYPAPPPPPTLSTPAVAVTESPLPAPTSASPSYYPPFRLPSSSYGHRPDASSVAAAPDPDPDFPDPPESRDRRLWELRLLHNYVDALRVARQPGLNPPISFDWTREVPLLALEDDAVLCAILAQSALHLWTRARTDAERADMRVLQTTYLGMALRGQRAAVARGLTRRTADRVCMASLTILHHAFALVQTTVDDEHGRWQPPLEWLRVGRGTGRVWAVAKGLLPRRPPQPQPGPGPATPCSDAGGTTANAAGGGEAGSGGGGGGGNMTVAQSRIQAFLSSPPHFHIDDIFAPAHREPYLWLLEAPDRPPSGQSDDDDDDAEAADDVALHVYENALSYVGWTARAAASGEAEFATLRRLAAFAVWMPDLFEEFCRQRRPRALVVLAWFFRLWIPYDHRWEVRDVGRRTVRGIYGVLDEAWRPKLDPIFAEYGL